MKARHIAVGPRQQFRRIQSANPEELGAILLRELKLPIFTWITEEPGSKAEFWMIQGREYWISLSQIESDQGRYIANLIPAPGALKIKLGWPRYYFGLERAKDEIEAWIAFNKQLPLTAEKP